MKKVYLIYSFLFSVLLIYVAYIQLNTNFDPPVANYLIEENMLPVDWSPDLFLSGYKNRSILDDQLGIVDFAIIGYQSEQNNSSDIHVSHVIWKYSTQFAANRRFQSDFSIPPKATNEIALYHSLQHQHADQILVYCETFEHANDISKCTSVGLYGNMVSSISGPIEDTGLQMTDFLSLIQEFENQIK